MNPQRFEQWVFETADLTPQQRERLEAELAGNPELRSLAKAWSAVESELRSAPQAAPRTGFTARWRLRLAERQRRRARRLDWLMLGLTLGGALLALTLLGAGAMGPLTTPAELTKAWTVDYLTVQSIGVAILGISKAMMGSLPLLLQISLSMSLLVTAGWVCTLWLASMFRYAVQNIPNGG